MIGDPNPNVSGFPPFPDLFFSFLRGCWFLCQLPSLRQICWGLPGRKEMGDIHPEEGGRPGRLPWIQSTAHRKRRPVSRRMSVQRHRKAEEEENKRVQHSKLDPISASPPPTYIQRVRSTNCNDTTGSARHCPSSDPPPSTDQPIE